MNENREKLRPGVSFFIGATLGSLAVMLGVAGYDATVVAEPSAPVAMDIATGSHVFPYRGHIARDGVPVDGSTVTLGITLTGDGWSYEETHTEVPVYAGAFEVLVGTTGAGLPEQAFTQTGVALALEVDGTPLAGNQTIYPAPQAVHRLERDDVDFDGRVGFGERIAWEPTTIGWPHDHADLPLALSRGAGWSRPVGIGRADSNRLVYDATRQRFYVGTDDAPAMEVNGDRVSLTGGVSIEGAVEATALDMSAAPAGATFSFASVLSGDAGGGQVVIEDFQQNVTRPVTLNGTPFDSFEVGEQRLWADNGGGVYVGRLRAPSLRVEQARTDASFGATTCPNNGVLLGLRRDGSGGDVLHCSAARVF